MIVKMKVLQISLIINLEFATLNIKEKHFKVRIPAIVRKTAKRLRIV